MTLSASTIAEGLSQTLEQRLKGAEVVARAGAAVVKISEALSDLDRQRLELLDRLDQSDVRDRLEELQPRPLVDSISTELSNLRRLHQRFSRSTVNVGVVGRARQGKSRLLQSMTGLTTLEIPDGSSSHCTGVRSTILHDASAEPHAEVHFHSEASFLRNVLGPYFRDLRLGAPPQSLTQFFSSPTPSLPEDLETSTSAEAKLEHLENYHRLASEYRELIGASPRKIGLSEIRSYVAQDSSTGERIFHRYLAVAEVRVFTKFPAEGVERVGVIDMPGLGDTGVGDEERLLTVLGQDVDLIMFVKMPKTTGDFWGAEDVGLYELAARSLTDLPLDRWSFVVLNHTKTSPTTADNLANCQRLAKDATAKHIESAGLIVVDCKDAEQVREQVLAPAIRYLGNNCRALDATYASASQDRITALQDSVRNFLSEAEVVLGRGSSIENELVEFDSLFESAWSILTSGLEALSSELRAQASLPSVELAQRVDQVIQDSRANPGLPDLDEIQALGREHGAYSTAFNILLHRLRTALAARFATLEGTLRISLDATRAEVAAVFESCGLGRIDGASGASLLEHLVSHFGVESPMASAALQTLCEVDLTYRGFLQYRLRQHLMVLHPDGLPNVQQVRVAPNAESVREALEVLYEDALYRVETAFEAWYSEPNEVAAAVLDEFIDRAIRSDGAKLEWRNLFLEYRASIWESRFEELGDRSRSRESWMSVVARAQQANGARVSILS